MTPQSNAAIVVAGDSREALSATDKALLTHTLLFASAIQAAERITLPVGTTQKVYRSINRGVQGILDGREAMSELIGLLRKIAAHHPGLEVAFEGCLDGLPMGSSNAEKVEMATLSPAQ